MKRAARPGESESESDDEGEDALERRALAESRAASSGGAALRQVTSARAVAASDRAGLERACKSIVAAMRLLSSKAGTCGKRTTRSWASFMISWAMRKQPHARG